MADDIIDRGAIERLQRLGGTALAEQMIDMYLANAPERVDMIVTGRAAANFDAVRRGAHSLKSTSANVGAVVLQQAAAELEAVASHGADADRISELALRVETAFAEARVALGRIREELVT